MKKVFLIVLVGIISFWSCQNGTNNLTDLQNKPNSLESFFEKMSNKDIKVGKEKVLLINYEWNAKEGTIKLIDSKEAEPSWGLALYVSEQKNTLKGVDHNTKYTVNCSKSDQDDKSWTKNCNRSLVYDFLNTSGHVVYKAPMVFVPNTKEFYIPSDRDITQLIELPIKQ